MSLEQDAKRGRNSWANWLLILPYIAMLWVPFYNRAEPAWAGIPFFYWYQLLWVILAAVLTALVYVVTEPKNQM